MKLTNLLPERILYRVNTPKWASMPTSGAGAAAEGGRFNRAGVEALYLSSDETTALREYQQDEPIMPPGTIAAYHVALDQVVDFTAGYVPAIGSRSGKTGTATGAGCVFSTRSPRQAGTSGTWS